MRHFLVKIWICLMTCCSFVFGQGLLTVNDVQPIMQQIFDQHVDQKEINNKIIKSSFKVYIDKFDPDRIYLLEDEVNPYLQFSEKELSAIVSAYKQNRFTAFENLNRTIQNAILRAQKIRQELEKSPAPLFTLSSTSIFEDDPDLKKPFPKNKEILQQNIKNYIVRFLNAEKQRFGTSVVIANQSQTIEILERGMQERENSFLYRDSKGAALPKKEQENLFALHMLKALAASLDAHTTFYDEFEASDLKMRLQKEFQGVGIVFQQNIDGSIVVGDLTDEGPAAKSGKIKIGDRILEVNGQKVAGMPFDKVMELIRSNKENGNSDLQLTLKHKTNSEIFKVKLKKQEITVKGERAEASFKKFDNGIIGLITLNSFYQNSNGITSERDIKDALKKFKQMGPLKGLILDLRENSGGFLNQAVKVAGLFITNGVIVISKYFNGEEHYYRDLDGKTFYEGPLVILTSRATASAAEIVAQALQDYGVAIVVGDESTYGKGTIQNQNVTDEKNKGASLFKVTVGKYYTVSGRTPQLKGVKPDIIVPGIFNFEHLGEQYLEFTVQNDTIKSEYSDDLSDITPNLKAWYQRYYSPTIQHKSHHWQKLLPTLRLHSATRMMENSDYQLFLKDIRSGHINNVFQNRNAKPIDFQLDETVKILQDMIKLDQRNYISRQDAGQTNF